MNIFAGIGFTLLGFIMCFLFGGLFVISFDPYNDEKAFRIVAGVSAVIAILSLLATYIVSTSNNIAYVEEFNARKATIEQSVNSENISGLERIELVKTATDLNGELARKKTHIKRWYTVGINKGLFDELDYIKLD